MGDWMASDKATLPGFLLGNAEAHPDRVTHVCDDVELTDGQLLARSQAYANAYADLGLGAGDVVATFMENRLEHAYSWGGCTFLGAGHLPCNTFLRGEFLRHQLGKTEAKLAVVDPTLLDRVLEIRGELPSLEHLVVRGSAAEAAAVDAPGLRVTSTEEIEAGEAGKLLVDRPARHDDLNTIIFTGGTTGPSKGVALSQNYIVSMMERTRACNGWTAESVYYQPLPLFHINAFGLTIIQPVLFGGRGVTASQLSITEFWSEVRRHGATHLSLFGPLYNMLYGMPPAEDDADNPARVSVGYCPVEIHRAFEQRFGIEIYSCYALSEAVMVTHTTPDQPSEPGWAGKPTPEMDVRLLDEDGDEVPTGEVGEICVRPKKPHIIFDGYYNDPEGTLAAFQHLWFHTGDLGRFNEQGDLQFVDRKADYLRRRGENISTYEVEQAVLRFPGIAEVAAHGVPAEIGEEEVKVSLRLYPGMTDLDHVAFLDHCVANMPYYAVPRFIEVVDDFPRSPIGRIQKFQLRERGITDATVDREAIGYAVAK
jgi:crotonobetaine/carnitine-CoA ligase